MQQLLISLATLAGALIIGGAVLFWIHGKGLSPQDKA